MSQSSTTKTIAVLRNHDIAHMVLAYLPLNSLYRASVVCKDWQLATEENELWSKEFLKIVEVRNKQYGAAHSKDKTQGNKLSFSREQFKELCSINKSNGSSKFKCMEYWKMTEKTPHHTKLRRHAAQRFYETRLQPLRHLLQQDGTTSSLKLNELLQLAVLFASLLQFRLAFLCGALILLYGAVSSGLSCANSVITPVCCWINKGQFKLL